VYKTLLSVRSHGWNRDWSDKDQKDIEKQYNIDNINAMYTFYYPGFNLRATDIQAFLGIEQLTYIDQSIACRYDNFELYNKLLKNSFCRPTELSNSMTSNFAYPCIHPKKNEIVGALKENNIETRPLVCGSMGTQPFYSDLYGEKYLENCTLIDNNGIYLPNHPLLTIEEISTVCDVVNNITEG
jgi:CDP-6-deoxy-D-xylo-4-hexulose-3-dehydrase